jgi:hypothetical protein
MFHQPVQPLSSVRRKLWKRFPQRSQSGQAILELALSVTFLAFIFAAAVDLGIAYKSYQTLVSATAEAGNYLTLYPVGTCQDNSIDQVANPTGYANCINTAADVEARIRFRGEQGNQLRGTASTLDLDANGRDDLSSTGDNYGTNWIVPMVQIDEADSTQVTIGNDNFATVADGYNPSATNAGCQQRKNLSSGQCFIVIRSQIIYRPFAISPVVGNTMTIRATSVQPIVNGLP